MNCLCQCIRYLKKNAKYVISSTLMIYSPVNDKMSSMPFLLRLRIEEHILVVDRAITVMPSLIKTVSSL